MFIKKGFIGTVEQRKDPNYCPPFMITLLLGFQHIVTMFFSNVIPTIIVAGAAGFGFGSNSPDFIELLYLIQMSMLFAGIATLMQTITIGPIGSALPIVQGTSFAFLPIMIPIVAGKGVDGLATLYGGIVIGGIFHALLGTVIGKVRIALPPVITGLIVLMIGLGLIRLGIQNAAGGLTAIDELEFGSFSNWSVAWIVIIVTIFVKFRANGVLAASAVLIGIIVGYFYALFIGIFSFESITESLDDASYFALPNPFRYGVEFSLAAIVGFCLMAFVSAIETVGDVEAIAKSGAERDATDKEIRGATYADGIGTALAGIFGGLPNTSISQNVGLIAITSVMSRHVVTVGAVFLVLCGLIPKVGALIQTIPIEVLGGGVIVMFGMVVATGMSMLSKVEWTRRNMVIFAISLSIGLGLQLELKSVQHLPDFARILLTSGLLPATLIAITLNIVLPRSILEEEINEE